MDVLSEYNYRNIREGIKKVRITEQAFERMINDICKE